MSTVRKDENGYLRKEFNHSDLIHRQVAYKEIYLPNRDKYNLPFSKYQVHHKDQNKQNNNVSNLLLVTLKEHEKIHNINNNKNYFDKIVDFNKKRKKNFKSKNYFKKYNTHKYVNENPYKMKGIIFLIIGIILLFSAGAFLGIIFIIIGTHYLNKK